MDRDRTINSLRFNQDKGCFTCAMESGLRIYNVEPLAEQCHYDIGAVGSVAFCEMLYRTNLLAIVSGGSRPKFPDNCLHIYDDLTKQFVLRIKFNKSVIAVRLRRDKLVVALINQIHVFSFPTPTQKLFSFGTTHNPRGLCEITPGESCDKQFVIYPGLQAGVVQILDVTYSQLSISKASICINAHRSELACMIFNEDGTIIATASTSGTLIRLWDIATQNKLMEFRRGSESASIYCLNFSRGSEYMCCASDKGTIHIFAVKNPDLNKRMMIHNTKLFGEYGSSQWSMATFTIKPEKPCICAFSALNSVVVACLDGTFHKYVFNQDGNCSREAYDVFLDIFDEDDDLL